MGSSCTKQVIKDENKIEKLKHISDNIFNYYHNKAFEGYYQKSNNGSIIFTKNILNYTSSKIYIIKEIFKLLYKNKSNNFNEIDFQNENDHPNILKPIILFETENLYHLLFEKPESVPLSIIIRQGMLNHDFKTIQDIIQQLLEICSQMHSKGIMIRNLNPDIILFNIRTSKVFIVDLGSCSQFPTSDRINTNIITSAPEIITKHNTYDQNVDVWSIGIIFFLLLYGQSPYILETEEYNEDLLIEKVRNADFINKRQLQNKIDNKILEYLNKFLIKDPLQRTSIEVLLEDIEIQILINRDEDFSNQQELLNNSIQIKESDLFKNQVAVKLDLFSNKLDYLQRSIDKEKKGSITQKELQKMLNMILVNKHNQIDSKSIVEKMKYILHNENENLISQEDFYILNQKLIDDFNEIQIFENFMKLQEIKESKDLEVDLDDFIRSLNITSQIEIHKIQKFVKQTDQFCSDKNVLQIEGFVKHMYFNTKQQHSQKLSDWYLQLSTKQNRKIRGSVHFDENDQKNSQIKLNILKALNHNSKQEVEKVKQVNYSNIRQNKSSSLNSMSSLPVSIQSSIKSAHSIKNNGDKLVFFSASSIIKIKMKNSTQFINDIVNNNHNDIQFNQFNDIDISIEDQSLNL